MMSHFKPIHLIKNSLIIAITLYLAGCANPNTLGLNNNQWARLTPAQQKAYKSNHISIQNNLKKQSKLAPQAKQLDIDNSSLPNVDLTVLKGFAAFAPNFSYQAISPLHIHLQPGRCASSIIHSLNQKQSTTLWFCYIHKMIGIDPSFYKMNQAWGTVFIDINPLWNQGYTYTHISTSGFARLNNASIYIKASSPIDLTPKAVDLTQLVTLDNPSDQTHE